VTATTGNIFDLTLALLREKGWTQGLNQDADGHLCLGYALRTAANFALPGGAGLREYNEAWNRLGGLVGRNLVLWNDDEARTFPEVETILETASRNYNQEVSTA
jgi:hypothetical protein